MKLPKTTIAVVALLSLSAALLIMSVTARATVTTSVRSVTYTPGSPTTVFAVTFPFIEKSHLDVVKTTISTGTPVTLVQGTDYGVTLPVGSHQGVVTTYVSVTTTHTLTITRNVPLTQTTSYSTQGRYNASAHEASFDKVTMMIHQLAVGAVSSTDITNAINSHEGLSNPHTGYHLTFGAAGGQYATGGTGVGENLTLRSTSHPTSSTRGRILFGTSAYDEPNNRLGIGTFTPNYALEISGGELMVDGASAETVVSSTEIYNLSVSAGLVVGAKDVTGVTLGAYTKYYPSTHPTIPHYATMQTDDFTITDSLANELMHLTATGMTLTDVSVLTLDDSTAGGTLYGGTGTGEDITIKPNSAAANGTIFLGASSGFVESATPQLGVGTATPLSTMDVRGDISGARKYYPINGIVTLSGVYDCNAYLETSKNNDTITLPALSGTYTGCQITVTNGTAGSRIRVEPNVSDAIHGSCVGGAPAVYTSPGTTAYAAEEAAGLRGDYITVTAGTDIWYITGCFGVWTFVP